MDEQVESVTGMRPDWSFRLMSVCQELVGRMLFADREQFAMAMQHLEYSLPDPIGPVESTFLRRTLFEVTTRAGYEFHRRFHTHVVPGSCTSSVLEESWPVWLAPDGNHRAILRRWSENYVRWFDKTHQWPLAAAAAKRLRTRFDESLDVDAVARSVGMARTALTRAFMAHYGVTLRAYQTRVRLRRSVTLLQDRELTVDAVAMSVGYKSPKNFYRALRDAIALRPDDVRGLSQSQRDRLFANALALPKYRARPDLDLSAEGRC